jgi:hypothetical protein
VSVDASVGASFALGDRQYLGAELAAQTHFFSVEDQAGANHAVARFALRGLLALGLWF